MAVGQLQAGTSTRPGCAERHRGIARRRAVRGLRPRSRGGRRGRQRRTGQHPLPTLRPPDPPGGHRSARSVRQPAVPGGSPAGPGGRPAERTHQRERRRAQADGGRRPGHRGAGLPPGSGRVRRHPGRRPGGGRHGSRLPHPAVAEPTRRVRGVRRAAGIPWHRPGAAGRRAAGRPGGLPVPGQRAPAVRADAPVPCRAAGDRRRGVLVQPGVWAGHGGRGERGRAAARPAGRRRCAVGADVVPADRQGGRQPVAGGGRRRPGQPGRIRQADPPGADGERLPAPAACGGDVRRLARTRADPGDRHGGPAPGPAPP